MRIRTILAATALTAAAFAGTAGSALADDDFGVNSTIQIPIGVCGTDVDLLNIPISLNSTGNQSTGSCASASNSSG
ncbi:hypothetical protein [Streptomyces bluensis]|uniref:hypothetical protein n=1 Tax=Streptomyces bluensis TaxID=33897 RepID=UPI001678EE7C|nr:hypothetical protein [Streptomyces bluensis]GGZ51325.1 hypothetical protein GCM10010344_16570 [Streptomyces bluensis]